MGEDKAFVEVGGKPLIKRVIEVAGRISDEVVLVASDPGPLMDLGFPILADEIPGRGPLEALRVGLDTISASSSYALACDLPHLQAGPLLHLAELLRDDLDAVIPAQGGRLQPLCALYQKRCVAAFTKALEADERALHRAVQGLKLAQPSGQDIGAAPDFFDNLNTPEDLARERGDS